MKLRGVYYKRSGCYEVTYMNKGQQLYLGRFKSYFDACCARKSAENKYVTTDRHTGKPEYCCVEGCHRLVASKRMCQTHYSIFLKGGNPSEYEIRKKKEMSELKNAHRNAYNSWKAMKSRCKNEKKVYYASKGIGYDEKWSSFKQFFVDMGDRPEGMTLDRIDPDQDYSKGNCRWASNYEQTTQNRHRQETKIFTGVRKKKNRYEVAIGRDYIGSFKNVDDAIERRVIEEQTRQYRLI